MFVEFGDMAVDGIPQIEASIAESTKCFADYRISHFAGWHPQRLEMLVLTRPEDGQTRQVHLVQTPLGNSIQLTAFDDRIISVEYEPKCGKYCIFSKDVGGGEWIQNFLLNLESKSTTMLTDGKSKNTKVAFSNRGDRVAFGSTRRNGKDIDFYVMTPEDPSSIRCIAEFSQGLAWWILEWSPDDLSLLAIEYISINDTRLWLIDAETGARAPVAPRDGAAAAHHSACFSRDGLAVYTATDRGAEFLQLARVDLATGEHRVHTAHIPWSVEAVAVSRATGAVAFATNEAGVSVLRLLDPATGAERAVAGLPAGVVSGLAWHPAAGVLGFSLTSARSPTDAYTLDLTAAGGPSLVRWTATPTPGLDAAALPEAELFGWAAADGLRLSGFLYRPPAARHPGPRPVMVVVHGGPEEQSRPVFLGEYSYLLAELGVALVYPNIRGSTGYGRAFVDLDNGRRRPDAYADVGALLDWIAARPEARIRPRRPRRPLPRSQTHPSRRSESTIRVDDPSRRYKSLIRVADPSPRFQSPTRGTHPSRRSESQPLIRVASPSCRSEPPTPILAPAARRSEPLIRVAAGAGRVAGAGGGGELRRARGAGGRDAVPGADRRHHRRGAMQRDAAQRSAMRRVVRCGATQRGAMQRNAAWCDDAAQCRVVRCSATQRNTQHGQGQGAPQRGAV